MEKLSKCRRCNKVLIWNLNKRQKFYCSGKCWALYRNQVLFRNENNPAWKGDKVKYQGLHAWMVSKYGKGIKCQKCKVKGFYYIGITGRKKWSIEWAQLKEKSSRDRKDWLQLCKKCHVQLDQPWKKRGRCPTCGRF